jgi:hypothetical protein
MKLSVSKRTNGINGLNGLAHLCSYGTLWKLRYREDYKRGLWQNGLGLHRHSDEGYNYVMMWAKNTTTHND